MPRVPLDRLVRTRFGKAVAGAELFVYDRGTSDEVTGYTTEEGTTEISQPLVSDEEGAFPDAWFPVGAYDSYIADDTVSPRQPWEAVAFATTAVTHDELEALPERASVVAEYLNVKEERFGALGNGSDYDDDAFAAAIALLPNVGSSYSQRRGGKIIVPPGRYKFADPMVLQGLRGVTIEGPSGASSGYGAQGAVLVYTGDDDRFIDARSTYGTQLRNLHVSYNNAGFEGVLIDLQHGDAAFDSSYFLADNCTMYGEAVNSAEALISFKEAILCEVRGGQYSWAQAAFRLREDMGGDNVRYSNAHRFTGVTFANVKNAIMNAGEVLEVDGCWFEGTNQDSAGMIHAYADDLPANSLGYGISFTGCWFGDAVLITEWLNFGSAVVRGLNIAGCAFLGGTKGMKFAKGGQGLSICGNSFGVTNAVDLGSSSTGIFSGVSIQGNDFSSTTGEPVLNASGHHGVNVLGNSARNGENQPKDLLTIAGHIGTDRARGTAPTAALVSGGGSGSGASVSVAGSDTAGTITLTTGTGASESGLLEVTFAEEYDTNWASAAATPKIQLTPRTAAAAKALASAGAAAAGATKGFRLSANATPTSSASLIWDYMVIQ